MSALSSSGPRWTIRTWLLYAAGGALLALGVGVASPVPLFVAIPLLLAPAAAFLAAPVDPGPIALRWEESGHQGSIEIHGRMDLPPTLDSRDLRIEIPRSLGIRPSGPLRVDQRPGVVEFWGRWTAAEPVLAVLDPPRVTWSDPLGLLERPLSIEAPPLAVERYPPEIGRLAGIRLRRTIVLPGETRSRALGESGEFYGLRPTVPGDSARRINWPAVARTGRMFSNEFNLERTGDLLLFIDARPSSLGLDVD
ncbi:MAG: DUF58 domain-containing protein, partial [Thermoplasmata archaeon]